MLKQCGARVMEAASSVEALNVLTNKRTEHLPHVLVCDIRIPGEDGYALIQNIRALDPESAGSIPAIALTAKAGAEDRARCLAAGFQAHVSKPVEPSELVTVVVSLAGPAEGD
ncbi:MAG: response regulator, partial [Pyrinomonadaceae bacterium]